MNNLFVQIFMCVQMLLPVAAAGAEAVVRDPLNYPLKQYGFILFMSMAGGVVGYYAKLKRKEVQPWNLQQLIGELCTSSFSGLVVFLGCEYLNVDRILSAAIVGIAGHMGTRTISLLEDLLKLWIERRAPKGDAP
jgi:hypothetical protein